MKHFFNKDKSEVNVFQDNFPFILPNVNPQLEG